MQPHDPDAGDAAATDESVAEALRDARRISDRIAADEAAADAARERYRDDGLPVLLPDPSVVELLPAGELLHAAHGMALIEQGSGAGQPVGGTLLVTSRRLVHARAGETLSIELPEIAEMSVALERILLVSLRDGSDLAIEVDQPRLLRVQLAAAIAELRGRGAQGESETGTYPSPGVVSL